MKIGVLNLLFLSLLLVQCTAKDKSASADPKDLKSSQLLSAYPDLKQQCDAIFIKIFQLMTRDTVSTKGLTIERLKSEKDFSLLQNYYKSLPQPDPKFFSEVKKSMDWEENHTLSISNRMKFPNKHCSDVSLYKVLNMELNSIKHFKGLSTQENYKEFKQKLKNTLENSYSLIRTLLVISLASQLPDDQINKSDLGKIKSKINSFQANLTKEQVEILNKESIALKLNYKDLRSDEDYNMFFSKVSEDSRAQILSNMKKETKEATAMAKDVIDLL